MEEIDLKSILNGCKKNIKLLIIFIIIGCVLGFTYGFTKYIIEPKEGNTTILIDKNAKAISTLVDGYNTKKITGKFDASTFTISITCIGKSDDEINKIIEEYKNKLQENLTTNFEVNKFEELNKLEITNKNTLVDTIKTTLVGLLIAVIIYVIVICIIQSYKTTTDEYALYELTKLKVLGNIHNKQNDKENIDLIKANIDINEKSKILMFIETDSKTNQKDLIKKIAESYKADNEKVTIISNNIDDKKIAYAIKKSAKKNEIIETLNKLSKEYDRILIDGNSLTQDYKTTIMTGLSDKTIIVARAEKSSTNDILKTKQLIFDIKENIAGIILK